MNNVALIADPHFGVKKNSEIYLESQIKFFVKQFVPYLRENQIKKIFFLGDLFDNRSSINTKIQNEVFDLFDNHFKEFEIYMLIGNHDCYFNSSIDINSIKFLSKFENIKIIDKTEVIECYNKKVLLVPWLINFTDFIIDIENKNFDISFGHFNIKGFHYNKSKISEDGLDANLFGDKCKKLFSGHFHIRSKQIYKNCEIIYIGSPYQLTRADIDEQRGFVVLNMDDLSYEFIDNELSMKFIKLIYPQKFTEKDIKGNNIDVHIKYDENYSEEKINKYLKEIANFYPAFTPQIIIETDNMLDANFDVTKLNLSSIPDLMMDYINSIDIKNKDSVYNILIELYNVTK